MLISTQKKARPIEKLKMFLYIYLLSNPALQKQTILYFEIKTETIL